MRIIAGRLGGRVIDAPKGHRTHPMADRVRGGLFNALGDIEGLSVLDAFGGSGALSIEAVSRGAGPVITIDVDKKAHDAILNNINQLGVQESIKAVRSNAGSWSDQNREKLFDIVIAAPPYDDLRLNILTKLARHVVPSGIYVLDWPGKKTPPILDTLEQISNKSYGDAQIVFYKKLVS